MFQRHGRHTSTSQAGNRARSTFFSFDISWNDPVLNKFFLADRNNKTIDVVDPTTFAITQFVNPGYAGFTGNNDTSGPDGVLTANRPITELWVGDSPGKVWVLDATTGAVKIFPGGPPNPILVGGTTRADELCYDPKDNLIMIASPGRGPALRQLHLDHDLSGRRQIAFDGRTKGTPKATNGLEQCGWSPETGRFYKNVPEVNGPGNDTAPGAIAVISPATMTSRASFPVPIAALRRPARNGHRPE